MKKIIISVLLSMFLINLHAQNALPYKSLSDFKNDTTAFINYNFIDRAEQYIGKTLEFIVRDLQIPVKRVYMSLADEEHNVDGLYLSFYGEVEMRRISESTISKPYAINVNWAEKVPIENFISPVRARDYNKIINNYKDFQIIEIDVRYPPKSEHVKGRPKGKKIEKD